MPVRQDEVGDVLYGTLSFAYDAIFGRILQPGRAAAVSAINEMPGAAILEVGVGTGLNATLYLAGQSVTGIDISEPMLQRARERVARERLRHLQLARMDARHLAFADASFDIVYAPYSLSAVPNPVEAAREMRRVCKPGGRILILNHFRSANRLLSGIERIAAPFTARVGFNASLDLNDTLADADLTPCSVVAVNVPPIWQLVSCTK
jgi:phosphatidylethanolamine/phosphatidyl-N-methylethanolamine N-methyltransferase